MDYIVRGERTSISKESIIMNVKDGLSPIIKLKGKQVVRISSQENFTEPGFSLVNANDMEDSLILVERIVPQDYDGLGFKHIQYMFADSNVSESITRRTIKQYDDFPFK